MLSLARMYFYGDASSPLNTIIRERVHQTQCSALLMFQRAVDRGEFPSNTEIECLRDLSWAALNPSFCSSRKNFQMRSWKGRFRFFCSAQLQAHGPAQANPNRLRYSLALARIRTTT